MADIVAVSFGRDTAEECIEPTFGTVSPLSRRRSAILRPSLHDVPLPPFAKVGGFNTHDIAMLRIDLSPITSTRFSTAGSVT
jgi:hypothetical protein